MIHVSFQLSPEAFTQVYDESVLRRLRQHAQLTHPPRTAGNGDHHLASTEIIFSGWGAPRMDEGFLRIAPRLRAVFYAGGSTRYFTTEAFWKRGIRLSSAFAINAIPVSEYTVSVILLALKRFWHLAEHTRRERTFSHDLEIPGAFGSSVGLVSYGTIARLVRQRLRQHDVSVLVYDPHLTPEEAEAEQVRLASLEEVFAATDVVSLHAPLLDETRQLITARHFRLMRQHAVLINTARGGIVNEAGLIEVLNTRSDIYAILDVTDPEPPAPDSPLYRLPNVLLTPHVAGSLGSECKRMGHAMVDEFERYLAGEPLRWEITPDKAALMA